MGMTIRGTAELQQEFLSMVVSDEKAKAILAEAAQPILEQMKQNASTDPKRRTGKLYSALSIETPNSKVPKATIGIHRKDMDSSGVADYAYPVEYGHAGPHPAPPHPFIRPAFDARKEEAFKLIREGVKKAMK